MEFFHYCISFLYEDNLINLTHQIQHNVNCIIADTYV